MGKCFKDGWIKVKEDIMDEKFLAWNVFIGVMFITAASIWLCGWVYGLLIGNGLINLMDMVLLSQKMEGK